MSTGPGGPTLGEGGFFGGTGGPGGFGGLGGMMGPRGPFGAWPSCGCSSCFIILAGILLVIGGCLRMINF
jgi:hypothetical protein